MGIVGYRMKDNREDHFVFMHYNVSSDDLNGGKVEYVKFWHVWSQKSH